MDKIKKIWGIWEFIKSVSESSQLFVIIFISSGVVVMIWGVVYTWVKSLETSQLVLFAIGTFCFLLVFIRLVYDRWQRHNIEQIPDLIEKLDVMTSSFVDDFKIELSTENWENINKDYSNLLGLDLSGLVAALQDGDDKRKIERAFEDINRVYARKLDPDNKTGDSLANLGDMGSILDTYNVGFGRLKETPQYQKLDNKIKSLQRKAPSAYISIKVNDYYLVSERLYTMILGTKPLFDQPLLVAKMPAKVKAKKSQIRPVVDGQISNLISGVREAILKHKERNMEQRHPEQTKDTSVIQNRRQRRANK